MWYSWQENVNTTESSGVARNEEMKTRRQTINDDTPAPTHFILL